MVLVLVGFTLPFAHTNIVVAGYPMTPAKAVTAVLLVFVLLRLVIQRNRLILDRKAVAVLAFGASVAASATVAFFADIPLPNLIRVSTTWFLLLIFYFLLVHAIEDEGELDVFLMSVVAGAIFVTITGFLGLGFQTYSAEGGRIGGEGGNPNTLAFNLVLALPLAASFMESSRSAGTKVLWMAALLALLSGVAGTLSRSGLVALLGVGLYWGLSVRKLDPLRFGVPFLLVVAFAFFFMPESVAERVGTLSPEKLPFDNSARSRMDVLPFALQAIGSHPLLGIGLLRWLSWSIHAGSHVHNVIHNAYLQVAVEQGLLGLVPFLLITVFSWRDLSRVRQAGQRLRRRGDLRLRRTVLRAEMLQVGMLGILVISQFQPTMRYRSLWATFALSSVVLAVARSRLAAEPSQAPEVGTAAAPMARVGLPASGG